MLRRAPFLILFCLLPLLASCEEEDDDTGPVTVVEEEPGLLNQASISADSAVGLARARVPGGHIEKAEIEMEDGRLIYTFDMKPGGEEGEEEEAEEAEEGGESETIIEVNVDAMTGVVVSVVEEAGGEEDEAMEAGEEGEEDEAGEAEEEGEETEALEAASGQITEESPGLLEQTAFSPDSALALARVRFPEARLLQGELEMEEGRLVYSLDLGIEGEEGVTEVWVDALTGEIISVEHEGGEGAGPRPSPPRN